MADYVISQFTLLDGKTVEIKDAAARAAAVGGTHFLGVTTTEIEDGSSTASVTIAGQSVTAANGDIVAYGNKEFIYASIDSKWHEMGDLTGLGALALKSSVSASYTPAGTVSKPNVSVTPSNATIKEFDGAGSVTPGSANVPTAVTLPTWDVSVSGENMTFTWNAGSVTPGTAGSPTQVVLPTSKETSVLTGVSAELDAAPAFTGTPATIVSQ